MYWSEFFVIALAHLVAVASPGPDFAIVLRQSVTHGTSAGLWTSLGVAIGILLHVAYCLLGVAVLLAASPSLLAGARFVAAAYLGWLGLQALRSSIIRPEQLDDGTQAVRQREPGAAVAPAPRAAVFRGFLTNGLNPKATLFFLALFTVVISQQTPLPVQAAYGLYLSVATFAWFALLSVLLGREAVRRMFQRSGYWFDRIMGVVLIALAIQIATFS